MNSVQRDLRAMGSRRLDGLLIACVVAVALGAMGDGSSVAGEEALAGIVIAPGVNDPKYERQDWHDGWDDADRDCQNTREELLQQRSRVPVTLKKGGCKVAGGEWVDPYSGLSYFNADQLQVDHLVPPKEAHISGGYAWPVEKKRLFAEDAEGGELVLVFKDRNRSKGARDPGRGWYPDDLRRRCDYIRQWVAVKRRWALTVDESEAIVIRKILQSC